VKIAVSEHPRAVRSVRRTRAAAGLAGFVVAALLAFRGGLPPTDVLTRALLTGVCLHVIGWVFALAYWRAAIRAELEVIRRRRESARSRADALLRETAETSSPAR
jgi:type VI protein secretion system component VasK